jgi:hypothetical protein
MPSGTELVQRNTVLGSPVAIAIALWPGRPLDAVMADPDFQPILAHKPQLDFTWSFTSANGRITRDILPESMKLRVVSSRPEACLNTYNGAMVLPDSVVMGCSCVAAMDAIKDLGIVQYFASAPGGALGRRNRGQAPVKFSAGDLNSTWAGCDMYRDLEFYQHPRRSAPRQAELGQRGGEGYLELLRLGEIPSPADNAPKEIALC